jgi:tRNA dimethylallyltransferase
MFEAGFVEEVQALLDGGLTAGDSAMSSIGYREVARYLAGEFTLAEARDETINATRRLVRRQRQWFRKDDPRIRWIRDTDDIAGPARDFLRCRTERDPLVPG